MYSGSLITELKSTLTKVESPPETPVGQKSKCACCHNTFVVLGLFPMTLFHAVLFIIYCGLIVLQLLLSLKRISGPQL